MRNVALTLDIPTGLKDGLLSKGGVEDSRNIKFDITELTNEVRNPHVNFYLRLNHSRLITSKLQWRPDMGEYLEVCPIILC